MTTMKYQVAYLHPSLYYLRRLYAFTIDSAATMDDFIPRLEKRYPKHTKDLNEAILWRVSRLFSKNLRLHLTDITGHR